MISPFSFCTTLDVCEQAEGKTFCNLSQLAQTSSVHFAGVRHSAQEVIGQTTAAVF